MSENKNNSSKDVWVIPDINAKKAIGWAFLCAAVSYGGDRALENWRIQNLKEDYPSLSQSDAKELAAEKRIDSAFTFGLMGFAIGATGRKRKKSTDSHPPSCCKNDSSPPPPAAG